MRYLSKFQQESQNNLIVNEQKTKKYKRGNQESVGLLVFAAKFTLLLCFDLVFI